MRLPAVKYPRSSASPWSFFTDLQKFAVWYVREDQEGILSLVLQKRDMTVMRSLADAEDIGKLTNFSSFWEPFEEVCRIADA